MINKQTLEISVRGMDCAECTEHVHHAIAALPGVESVNVFLASEKAVVRLDPARVDVPAIRKAVEGAGYAVADPFPPSPIAASRAEPRSGEVEGRDGGGVNLAEFTNRILTLFGLVFGAVLFVVVIGEWLGLFETLTARVPWPVGLAAVLVAGYPVFRNVLRATLKGHVIAHTLMSLGVLAALVVGQWATAAVVVFFMRVGDYAERFTTERARRAVKDLTRLAPQMARVEREGAEVETPIGEVTASEIVVVRPGEKIPVDGEVVSGQATVDQASITGESMPVEAGPGTKVFAATLARLGSLRVRATHVGTDTTFGRVIRMVEEAEAHRADVQRIADKFSAYYLPVVAGVAALTFLIRRDPLATAAVLVVACSCSFALATPIAMLASVGAGAKRGLLIKGGKYLEALARADVLLIDKTGTLTLGKPAITDVVISDSGFQIADLHGNKSEISDLQSEILQLAASAERYSEHPLAEAVRQAALERGLRLLEPQDFEALPGLGVRARVNGNVVTIGSRRMVVIERQRPERNAKKRDEVEGRAFASQAPSTMPLRGSAQDAYSAEEIERSSMPIADELEAQGKTLLYVACDGQLAGVLAAADTARPEIPAALAAVRALGLKHIELLTGDNERTAAELAHRLGVRYRAQLLPEDKIAVVKEYQAKGHIVIMVGDGVNDAPALAQADVGIAMGAAGTDVAIEAAHAALMRDDWTLVPELLRLARRTMRVVKMNIAFTTVYNLVGLSLAALGFLPPIFAAAAQSLPDIGILANSSRLLRPPRANPINVIPNQ